MKKQWPPFIFKINRILKKNVVRPYDLSFYPNTVLDAIDFGYSRNWPNSLQFLLRRFILLGIGVYSPRGNSLASKYQICVFRSNNHDFCYQIADQN